MSVRSLLHERDGRLTRELLLSPGGLGLGQLPAGQIPDAIARSICGFCSTGCALDIHLRDGEAIGLTPGTDYPVNLGMACPKGWESLSVLQAEDRATTPLVRNRAVGVQASACRSQPKGWTPTDWDTALNVFVRRFKAIQEQHGPESIAFLSTGQIATEEMALLGCLAKFGMGMVHGDGNTRQCMATSVVAYKQAFGFDAPPYTYADLEQSDVLVFVGANPCVAHPILWERVTRNPHKPEIIVVDPRRTETAMQAAHHLALRPKSDLVLLYGLAHILIERGWIDREYIAAHTNGFEEFAAHVRNFPPEHVAEQTGLAIERLHEIARVIHEGKRVSVWWTMGVNQSYEGVRTAQSIINLALMTGNIGRPGTGANSITGQCNAMGSRLFSNTTNLLGGHDFENADHRRKIAGILGIDLQRIPDRNSWAYHEIMEGILAGRIRGLWIVATNTAHSWINQNQARDILSRLDFLVVQDMYTTTETAQMADLLLPAAGWGEKEGTFINSERRIGVIRKVARAPGQSLADFAIFKLIAHYWGCGEMFRDWDSPEAVFQILKRVSRGQPCDISGIADYGMLEEHGGVQWPFPEGGRGSRVEGQESERPSTLCATGSANASSSRSLPPAALAEPVAHARSSTERRLFEDGLFYHPDGRARFLFDDPRPMVEPPGKAYPLLLITGRGSASQWHTQTRTAKSAVLRKLSPRDVYVEINPADARRENIRPNQLVVIESQRGRIEARAFVTHAVQPGQVFIPMHYAPTNQLTDAVFDPYSKQPSYKACAVRVSAAS